MFQKKLVAHIAIAIGLFVITWFLLGKIIGSMWDEFASLSLPFPSKYLWWFLVALPIILLIWFFRRTIRDTAARTRVSSRTIGWWFTVVAIVAIYYWLFWALVPEVWNGWYNSNSFWPMTLVLILAIGFFSRTARGIGIALVLTTFVAFYAGKEWKFDEWMTNDSNQHSRYTGKLTWEDVREHIGECESGNLQFDAQGKVIKNPTTPAVGKYQIMASLHEDTAKSMGMDIYTEEGNEAYAKYLYDKNGLTDWEASRYCWESRMRSFGRWPSRDPYTIYTMVITKEWSKPVMVPLGERIYAEAKVAIAYELQTQTGEIYRISRGNEEHIKIRGRLTSAKFRVSSEEEVEGLTMLIKPSPL